MNGNETRRNASNIGQPDADHDMDGLLESQPSNGHPLPAICQKIDSAPIKLLKKLMAHRGPSGKIELDEEMTDMLMFLMESEADQKRQLQSVIEEMKTPPSTYPDYRSRSTYAPQTSPSGFANPLKGESAEQIVRKTNDILAKMNAEVHGEKVAVKAIRVLPSGDVSFYSKNRQHKEWLNKNKHEWSKQIHSDLEASPSTYQILAHGVPIDFDPASAQGKITLASNNSFWRKRSSRFDGQEVLGTPRTLERQAHW
ncbi:hypothetical protein PSTT_16901 [Puccinia striiformis]|uniref:Uncharacterized protein n=1 Tax=Puccinia striiformis TaxID=27350 RepID=A0A2S4UAP7_9BASI|nr:hypothetical protein PSTT_16901 [Puccinia striiformis]